jgi:molecular chaperone GrpE
MSEVQNDKEAKDTEGESINEEKKQKLEIQDESEGEEETEIKEVESGTEEQVVLAKSEVDELRKKAEESNSLLDKLLRARADFLNYQKRMRKGHETTAQYAIQDLVLDLLPELDNFERAAKLAENSKDIDKFVEGVKLIEGQLFKVLEKYGVKPIETVGKPFDPSLHEAVVEEENNELSHHTVIEELQRGFLLKERVIRPSKVKVSKRTVDEDKSDETNDNNSES